MISNKIDFVVITKVQDANPNGSPTEGNRPRTTCDGRGRMSQVCIKRKIRDRWMDAGLPVFIQPDDKKLDDCKCLRDRAEKILGKLDGDKRQEACKAWIDVRGFGVLLPYKAKGADEAISIGIRGPISVHSATSVEPVEIIEEQITKSVNNEGDSAKKGSDTIGLKSSVAHGIYLIKGSVCAQPAEKTGLDDKDVAALKSVLPKLFENDVSAARPDGSMQVLKVVWWKHSCKNGQYSSGKVFNTLKVNNDGTYELKNLEGLIPEEIDGF